MAQLSQSQLLWVKGDPEKLDMMLLIALASYVDELRNGMLGGVR
jgi:hypothetical protein